jgi:transcriptional regulator with XRE-family HTH domain
MRAPRLSPAAEEALLLLGWSIRAGRLARRWTSAELAERVGVSRPTISKIEHGDAAVAIGTYFEAATLVGVPLFDDESNRHRYVAQKWAELALLPARARRPRKPVDDDF